MRTLLGAVRRQAQRRRAQAQLTKPERQGLAGFEPTSGIADARPGLARGTHGCSRARLAPARYPATSVRALADSHGEQTFVLIVCDSEQAYLLHFFTV